MDGTRNPAGSHRSIAIDRNCPDLCLSRLKNPAQCSVEVHFAAGGKPYCPKREQLCCDPQQKESSFAATRNKGKRTRMTPTSATTDATSATTREISINHDMILYHIPHIERKGDELFGTALKIIIAQFAPSSQPPRRFVLSSTTKHYGCKVPGQGLAKRSQRYRSWLKNPPQCFVGVCFPVG